MTTMPFVLPDAWMFVALYGSSAAFVVALYALRGQDESLKEGRSALIPVMLLLGLSILLSFVPLLLTGYLPSIWANFLVFISGFPFLFALVLLLITILQIHGRIYHLREDKYLKYSMLYKWLTNRFKKDIAYEITEPIPRTPDSLGCLKDLTSDPKYFQSGRSILVLFDPQKPHWEILVDFLLSGLTSGETIHYVTCQQPSWFIWQKAFETDPEIDKYYNNLVFIDCYLPVFGFDDEILVERRKELERKGVSIVKARSIAGLHTAAAKAFNIAKKRAKRKTRDPHRMIYDSVSALADASSLERVKLFSHHMIPSERSYGMLTIMVESKTTDIRLLDCLKQLVDIICEINNEGKLQLVK